MKQVFSTKFHEGIKKYLHIKNNPGVWDDFYIEKTKKYIKYISWIPGLQMVGVGNSLAMNCGNKKSDIDLFIVSSPNRLWFVRILITLIFQILSVRKTPNKHQGRFCLSFFATTNGLNFSNFAITNDIYLYFWIIYFKPLLDYNNTYDRFISQNTDWLDLNEYTEIINNNKTYITYVKKTGTNSSMFLTIINNMCKKVFLPKTLKHYESIGKPYGIIITPDLLKFHNNDIRKKIRDELI